LPFNDILNVPKQAKKGKKRKETKVQSHVRIWLIIDRIGFKQWNRVGINES